MNRQTDRQTSDELDRYKWGFGVATLGIRSTGGRAAEEISQAIYTQSDILCVYAYVHVCGEGGERERELRYRILEMYNILIRHCM